VAAGEGSEFSGRSGSGGGGVIVLMIEFDTAGGAPSPICILSNTKGLPS
jgi:hypothetical protein